MTWTNRVVWQEGMFLRAQHFQQQDRWLEALVRTRTAALRPHPWGIVEMAVDRELLATGRFAVNSAIGVFEDGTPFAIPGETDHPPPLELPESTRNAVVYLAAPVRQAGAVEVAANGAEGRYRLQEFEAFDTHSASPQPAPLQIGRLRLRYMLETEERAGYLCIGLARIVEVAADRRASLDERWIPPALLCSGAPPLAGLITEFAGMLNQRGEALAARLTAPGGSQGVAAVSDFLLLQSINRWQKLLAHWGDSGNVHPEELYSVFVQMAGEFATFTEATKRPNNYPAYRHEDLQRSFAPVVADLRRSLSAVLEQNAIAIPLQERRYGVRVGAITDRSILRSSTFVLTVLADVPTETLQRLFPSQVKIGAVEHIRDLVNVAIPGIAVRPLPVAPRQIPFYAGASYFELDRNSPHWQQMQSSGGFAIHVSGEFPNLRLELWAIRG
ncbi:MAG: type VI secretion system baseplate subunit TssK [Alphaproteobacteria bacterium]|nr:type VI secretion system baseplate subunit TssK [Alphaproteobacteria bacterium]MBV9016392.1 type VI secretion system baseplate subunit TssK [Alphaproteobacteria bacterium]MBV9152666.1 type VI secretion system baseplate subunit TssK [Alphaproteobacteria bacterium]MBV9584673.1 type VI secretion system baseplate subunit TssK [Alphaproteobacteria bacterium]MBV9967086.1 type VI secretion system baseplate subunit TssK [Alphaproteobacteria bacterium]